MNTVKMVACAMGIGSVRIQAWKLFIWALPPAEDATDPSNLHVRNALTNNGESANDASIYCVHIRIMHCWSVISPRNVNELKLSKATQKMKAQVNLKSASRMARSFRLQ